MLENLIIAASFVFSLSLYINKFLIQKWDEREYFKPLSKHWFKINLGAAGATTAVALLINSITDLSYIYFVPLTVLVFVFFYSAWTDFKTGHAPSELAWAGIWLSLPFMLLGFITGGAFIPMFISVLLWGLVCFFLYFNRGLGDADVRLLWLVNVATVWWVGLYWSVLLFSAAAVLQLVVHIFASVFNWGRLSEVDYSKRMLKMRVLMSSVFEKIDVTKKTVTRRHVPFIPALTIGWIVGLTLLLVFIPDYVNVLNFGLVSL